MKSFEWFKNISNNIKKQLRFKNSIKNEENLYFEEQFNEYLEIEDCVFCYKMIDEGYKPSESKKNTLNKIMLGKINKGEYEYNEIKGIKSLYPKTKILSLLMSLSVEYKNVDFDESNESPEQKIIVELLNDKKMKKAFMIDMDERAQYLAHYYQGGIDITGDFYNRTSSQNEAVKRYFKNLFYVASIAIKTEIITLEEVQQIKKRYKSLISYMESKTAERYKSSSFERIGKSNIETFIKNISVYQAKALSKDSRKENLLNQLKASQLRQKPLEEEMLHLVVNEEYSMANLPINSKKKVETITSLIKNLDNKEVSDFVQERLPIILKRYFNIDEEYRTSLKNVEGYNAQELMNQSLDNIERIIIAKKEDNNYDLLSELSIENRKLKVRV